METAIVRNEAKVSEFGHEKADSSASRANHFRQHFLRYFGKPLWGFVPPAVLAEQEKSACQPFLGGVKQLVD
jgi:hypothetical protein